MSLFNLTLGSHKNLLIPKPGVSVQRLLEVKWKAEYGGKRKVWTGEALRGVFSPLAAYINQDFEFIGFTKDVWWRIKVNIIEGNIIGKLKDRDKKEG